MDENVLKIAMAPFFHDIGKFVDKGLLGISREYLNNNADVYQPTDRKTKQFSHVHALYTAAFIELRQYLLPPQLLSRDWGTEDSFINLAACHHKPETPLQTVITEADRLSSAWDRDQFQDDDPISFRDYKKTRMLPIFEQISRQSKTDMSRDDFTHYYSVAPMSPTSIFPKLMSADGKTDDPESRYTELFDIFLKGLNRLKYRTTNIDLWFENFMSWYLVCTSSIPAARAGKFIPDVSLYDHSRTTAALAAALYCYHRDNGNLVEDSIRDHKAKKFLFLTGDFYGIQQFVFASHGETKTSRSKLLRGRSFMVSMFCELAADLLCRELGLPASSVLLNAAGKFSIVAPNTDKSLRAVRACEERFNDWFVKHTYGESGLGISSFALSGNDLKDEKFVNSWGRLSAAVSAKKYSRIDLGKYGGVVETYLNSFNNDLTPPICPFCGKRPSDPATEIKHDEKAQSCCVICKNQIIIGEHLVKKSELAVLNSEKTKPGTDTLYQSIFDKYRITFACDKLEGLAESGKLFKHWQLGISSDQEAPYIDLAVKFLNGHVPIYGPEDLYDPRCKAESGSASEPIRPGDPKTFSHIARMALSVDSENNIVGTDALGVLKMDIDNLGIIMGFGIPKKRFTLSRLATLSRQIDFFFSLFLPHFLETEQNFNNIYTVFAGGDDLFLIGPWNRIIELSSTIRDKFSEYVCGNPKITLSAGISLHKPHAPVDQLSHSSEEQLQHSKSAEKNRVTVFEQTVTWDEMRKLNGVKNSLEEWASQNTINNGMLYRLNEFIESAAREKLIAGMPSVHISKMECTKWRSLLAYTVHRNVARHLKNEEREHAVKEVHEKLLLWLQEYAGALKIPLWQVLYNQR